MWQIIVIFAKNKSALMKKVLLILLFAALLPFAAADAQNIALGERVPELKVPAWLDGQKPAATPRLTYVEFFQSSNAACITSLKQLRAMTDKLGTKLRVVVITQEKEDKIGLPIAANLRGNRRRRQDLHGVRRAVRSVRGAGRFQKQGALAGKFTSTDNRNHREIKQITTCLSPR